MTFAREISVLDRSVRIWVCDTGNGLSVLIEGGDRGHVGATAVAVPGEPARVTELPGHREGVVCRSWAETLSAARSVPAVVTAGVHYDGIQKAQIQTVLDELEQELQNVLKLLNAAK